MQEQAILKEFEENDKQLEEIAGRIVEALSKVKSSAQDMNVAINKQGKMIKSSRQRGEKNEQRLQQQNNELKEMITKHKGGRQCLFDLILLFIFLIELAVLVKMLQFKGLMPNFN
jgi:hypothetical protein